MNRLFFAFVLLLICIFKGCLLQTFFNGQRYFHDYDEEYWTRVRNFDEDYAIPGYQCKPG